MSLYTIKYIPIPNYVDMGYDKPADNLTNADRSNIPKFIDDEQFSSNWFSDKYI